MSKLFQGMRGLVVISLCAVLHTVALAAQDADALTRGRSCEVSRFVGNGFNPRA